MFGRATIRLGIGPHSSYYYVFEVFKITSSVKSTYATLQLELQLDFQHGRRQPSLIQP